MGRRLGTLWTKSRRGISFPNQQGDSGIIGCRQDGEEKLPSGEKRREMGLGGPSPRASFCLCVPRLDALGLPHHVPPGVSVGAHR